MLVLGIESTCDETGASVVRDGKEILSNVLASSADLHEKYGGVFPELACRRHIDAILPVIDEALRGAGVTGEEIDLIAVAKGPGLVGALLIGMNAAKGLSIAWDKPLVGVNHVEAHLYASMMGLETIPTPALGIVISGGHTLLVKILDVGNYEAIGTTVDDAVGEAFDKVAVLLGLPYPGGPHVEKLAKMGNPKAYSFTAGKVKRSPYDFSFSGLKTAVLYAMNRPLEAQPGSPTALRRKGWESRPFRAELAELSVELRQGTCRPLPEENLLASSKEFFKGEVVKADIAASFQETALRDIAQKALLASKSFPCQAIFVGGGVSANQRLKEIMAETFPGLPIYWPERFLSVDNAAMIAGLGAKKFLAGVDGLDLEVQTRIPIA